MERVKGIGPSQPAWKAGALPLSYTRKIFGAEDGIRTRDPRLGKAILYHWATSAFFLVPRGGIEPPTRGFSVPCSTDWAIWAYGGEGGIWTLASLLKGSTPLAGEPLQPLEYFSKKSLYWLFLFGGEEGIRTLVSRKTLTVFKTAPLWPLRYLSIYWWPIGDSNSGHLD